VAREDGGAVYCHPRGDGQSRCPLIDGGSSSNSDGCPK
jgi:hypothetical protein